MKPRPPKVIPYFAGSITFTHPGGHERALLALAEMGAKFSNNGTHEPVSKEQSSSIADETELFEHLGISVDDGGLP